MSSVRVMLVLPLLPVNISFLVIAKLTNHLIPYSHLKWRRCADGTGPLDLIEVYIVMTTDHRVVDVGCSRRNLRGDVE
jgi:hypothetical protein